MIRRAAAVVLALTINPALVRAQDVTLTVTVALADVHKGPSTVTPVIGHFSRGAVVPVSRNLGSWVRIPWPEAPDGAGYVHVTMGRMGPAKADLSVNAASPSSAPTAAQASATSKRAAAAPTPPVGRTPAGATSATMPASQPPLNMPRRPLNVTPASHAFGLGGLLASPRSYGATARAWRGNRLGIQFGFTREALTSASTADRATSTQFQPAVVYGLVDRVSDYVWIRPYAGLGVSFRQQKVNRAEPDALQPVSDNGAGFRIFGGSELMFASVPRFGLSADVGYQRLPTLFPGFEARTFGLSIAGHWYMR